MLHIFFTQHFFYVTICVLKRLIMVSNNLKPVDKKAYNFIRSKLNDFGKAPTVRELAEEFNFKSSRSAALIINKLIDHGLLERNEKKELFLALEKELSIENDHVVDVPLVGNVPCGGPLLAEENIETTVSVSTKLARPPSNYFLLRAVGDSMNLAGVESGSLLLVRQQSSAENKQRVVALIDGEATVKELVTSEQAIVLMPRSDNPIHQPIFLTEDFLIQGIVIAVLPNVLS